MDGFYGRYKKNDLFGGWRTLYTCNKICIRYLRSLENNEIVAVIFIGGTEKLRETSEEDIEEKWGERSISVLIIIKYPMI